MESLVCNFYLSVCVCRSVTEIHSHVAGTLSNQQTHAAGTLEATNARTGIRLHCGAEHCPVDRATQSLHVKQLKYSVLTYLSMVSFARLISLAEGLQT